MEKPVKTRKRPKASDCTGFESLEKCYGCKFYTASGGKQFCSKHKIELKGDIRLRKKKRSSRS